MTGEGVSSGLELQYMRLKLHQNSPKTFNKLYITLPVTVLILSCIIQSSKKRENKKTNKPASTVHTYLYFRFR